MPLIETRGLIKSFDNVRVLDNINFNIKNNEFIIIAGKNGSGKTVLMKHLNGLLQPDSGEVFYRGLPIFKDIYATRSRIGLVFQHSDLQFVGQSVFSEIAFGAENLGYPSKTVNTMVNETADEFGLTGLLRRRPHELSGGEKKRVAIASIVIMDPEIILFDEPFAGLDYPGVVSILNTLDYLFKSGHTIAVITHDLEKVLGLATRLVVMNSGRIVYDGDPFVKREFYTENGLHMPYGDGREITSLRWN